MELKNDILVLLLCPHLQVSRSSWAGVRVVPWIGLWQTEGPQADQTQNCGRVGTVSVVTLSFVICRPVWPRWSPNKQCLLGVGHLARQGKNVADSFHFSFSFFLSGNSHLLWIFKIEKLCDEYLVFPLSARMGVCVEICIILSCVHCYFPYRFLFTI